MNLQEQILRIQSMMNIITESDDNSYKLYRKDIYNVSFPLSGTTDDALFVFGGISIGGKDFVYGKVPEDIKQNRIVITCEHNETLNEVLSSIKSDFSGDTTTPTNFKIKSVCGFSGGGPRTLEQLGKGYFIGLMDPYIDEKGLLELKSTAGKSQPLDKIRLLWGPGRWKDYINDSREISYFKEHGKHEPRNPYYNLIEAEKILGSSAKMTNDGHSSYVRTFFEIYHDLI
jgi:hypothetical protein